MSAVLHKTDKDKNRRILSALLISIAALVSVVQLIRADKRYGIIRYIRSQNTTSDFVDNYYIAPSKDNVRFPGKKRNLIFIYLESMETTYTDKAHGGDFDKDVIPELRELALKGGECFEGNNERLNGGHVITGATYTMSGIVAQTAGIPIAGGKTNAATAHADTFYPGIRTLGDILKDEGYNQAFMCGSPVSFGSREVYLKSHGCDDFFDYDYAAANNYIPKGYKVWWGFEDSRLFEFAKIKAADMASSNKPFALTILTADTHFEDGYVCSQCGSEYDTQYSNVIRCSSKQVTEFVNWLKEQDFYEDTTIILSGDHITMDADYCNGVDPQYERRTYTNIINPAVKPVSARHREYTTFDIFPTTLAAIGAEITGNRLGLGTDLFSDSPTLYERFGRATLEEELTRDSKFFRDIAKYDPLSKTILEDLDYLDMDCSYKDPGTLEVNFWGIDRAGLVIDSVRGEFFDVNGNSVCTCDFEIKPDKTWKGAFKTGLSYRDVFAGRMRLTAKDSNGEEHVFYENTDGRSVLRSEDIPSYLESISGLKNISVLIVSKGNAASGLSRKIAESFSHIDLECVAFKESHRSYVGAVGTGFRHENSGNGMMLFKGVFKDGKKFELASSDLLGSVVIDGKEYSSGENGYNFVVYDEQNGKVIDRTVFDLSPESASSGYIILIPLRFKNSHPCLFQREQNNHADDTAGQDFSGSDRCDLNRDRNRDPISIIQDKRYDQSIRKDRRHRKQELHPVAGRMLSTNPSADRPGAQRADQGCKASENNIDRNCAAKQIAQHTPHKQTRNRRRCPLRQVQHSLVSHKQLPPFSVVLFKVRMVTNSPYHR